MAAVVEGLPGLAKAHIQPKRLWVVEVEGPHQAGCRRHLLSNQLLRRRVAAGSGGLQGGRSLPVGHWLPLDEGGKVGGAVGLRKPQHLLVVTWSHCSQLINDQYTDQLTLSQLISHQYIN